MPATAMKPTSVAMRLGRILGPALALGMYFLTGGPDWLGYEAIAFDAVDAAGKAVYHTNVILSVGTGFAAIADFTIRDPQQHKRVLDALGQEERRIVKMRPDQLQEFTCNMLEVRGRQRSVAMSERAYQSLSASQRDILELFATLVHSPIPTIEAVGGGSVRCMLAEIFLPPLHAFADAE